MTWRCYNCGTENKLLTCEKCGFSLYDRDVNKEVVPLSPLLSDDAYVTLHLSPSVPQAVSAPSIEFADEPVPVSNSVPLGHRAFMASLKLVTSASIFAVTLVLAFLAVVVIKAFTG